MFRKPSPPGDPTGQSPPSLTAQAAETRAVWLAALDHAALSDRGIDGTALAEPIAEAGRAMAARVCLAMLQEGMLRAEPVAGDSPRVALPGPGEAALVLSGLTPAAGSLFPPLRPCRQAVGEAAVPLADPVALLELVAPLLEGGTAADLRRLAEELTDAQLNDALCRAALAAWNGELRRALQAAAAPTFWQGLTAGRPPGAAMVLLEQWSATGHPYHPTHKTRRGMSPAEALAFCPEFRPRVGLELFAVRKRTLRGETLPGEPPPARWLDRFFPAQAGEWRAALAAEGRDPEDYAALPVHPWQARHAVPARFARSLAAGDLLALPGVTLPADPLVSVRTLAAATAPDAPHIKLSLAVRLTSVERTISPRSCEMGPRISHLLESMIERDGILSETLRVLPEEVGLYHVAGDPEEAQAAPHLAAILRRNPALLCAEGEFVVPGTALPVISPLTGLPLFLELGGDGVAADAAAARRHFAHYAEAFLRPLLTLYLRYGIALEAHLQNSLVLCDAAGRVRRCLFRDFGGIRIYETALRAAGYDLEVHPDRLTVVDDPRPVRGKLTAHGLHRHLGLLIACLSQRLGIGEGPFWSDAAELVAAVMDELRGDVPAQTWRRERAALLVEDWEFKANLRMRLADQAKDVYVTIANPLRRTAA